MRRLLPLALACAVACASPPSDDGGVTDETDVLDTRITDSEIEDSEVVDTEVPCPDVDADSVCDDEDRCDGGDDRLDDDGDGQPDDCDRCPEGDDGLDDDGDGVADACDVCPGGFDPADADLDGTPDDCDACPADATGDSDGDTVCDSEDVCPGGDDFANADGDAWPDACDACPVDAPDDSDGDTVCDSDDVCAAGDDLVDTDGDGAADACDPCPADAPDDSDGDTVCDSVDACPGHDDAFDVDADTVPDACDPCPYDAPDDSDADGVCDSDDVCAGGADDADRDEDGTPDACDPCPDDPANDADGDGLCVDVDPCPAGSGIGPTGYEAACPVCLPFAGPMTAATYVGAPSDLTRHVEESTTAFGSFVSVGGTTLMAFEGPGLTLPAGDWSLRWRVRGGSIRRDLTLDLVTSGCAFTFPVVWPNVSQPLAGQWAWSAPLAVRVQSPCTILPRIGNTDTASGKSGYAFDHVRADALCHTRSDCPAVPGADAVCTNEGVCAFVGDDADGDDVCDAADTCPEADDRLDADLDRVPLDCDCDDADGDVWPGAAPGCAGRDVDCNGLDDGLGAAGEWLRSLTDYPVVWDEEFVFEEASMESAFGRIDVTDPLLSWLEYFDGPTLWLDRGRYVLDFAYAPTSPGVPVSTAVEPASTRGCVDETSLDTTSPDVGGDWTRTPPLTFLVTGDRCPVRARLWSHDVLKPGWRLDWSRVRRACLSDAECPDLADGTPGTCGAADTCEYLPTCL